MFRDLEIWLNHFEYHAEHPRRVPSGLSAVLKPQERRLIARSIGVFQLGEGCGGRWAPGRRERSARTGRAGADRSWPERRPWATGAVPPGAPAERAGLAGREEAPGTVLPTVARIMELMSYEQQRHAALLHAFMADHGLPLKRTDWTDFVFCCLRRIGGLEYRLHLFVTAELIASVYYRALEVVTGCQRLKVLCRTLVADELAHIGLQSQLLLTLRARKSAPLRGAIRLAHRAFFVTTASVVYMTHRRVLRAAGYDLGGFVRACSSQYDFYLEPPSRAQRTPTLEVR